MQAPTSKYSQTMNVAKFEMRVSFPIVSLGVLVVVADWRNRPSSHQYPNCICVLFIVISNVWENGYVSELLSMWLTRCARYKYKLMASLPVIVIQSFIRGRIGSVWTWMSWLQLDRVTESCATIDRPAKWAQFEYSNTTEHTFFLYDDIVLFWSNLLNVFARLNSTADRIPGDGPTIFVRPMTLI